MKRFVLSVLLAVSVVSLCTDDAFARGRRRSRGSSGATGSHMEYAASESEANETYGGLTMQQIAQARADAMASLGIMTHDIHSFANVPSWSICGVGEGIGCAGGDDPKAISTCIVGSRVVADAWRRAANGTIYRVRFFR